MRINKLRMPDISCAACGSNDLENWIYFIKFDSYKLDNRKISMVCNHGNENAKRNIKFETTKQWK